MAELLQPLFDSSEKRPGSFIGSFVSWLAEVQPRTILQLHEKLREQQQFNFPTWLQDWPEALCADTADGDEIQQAKRQRVDKLVQKGYLSFLFTLVAKGCFWDSDLIPGVASAFFDSPSSFGEKVSLSKAVCKEIQGAICRDIAAWEKESPVSFKTAIQHLAYKSYGCTHRRIEPSWPVLLGLALQGALCDDDSLVTQCLNKAEVGAPLTYNDLCKLWQPRPAKAVAKVFGITPEADTSCCNSDSAAKGLAYICAQHSEMGARDHHRHGACIYLNVDRLKDRNDAVGELARQFTSWDETIIALGRNQVVYTKGWKCLNTENASARREQDERWKVIHAEVDCLIQVAQNPELRGLLAPVARRDWEHLACKDYISFSECPRTVDPKIYDLAKIMESEWPGEEDTEYSGPLGCLIMELDNAGISYRSAQACPLCIKGLKRWGIGSQCYTVDEPCLFKREKIRVNQQLVCESLRSALNQLEFHSHPCGSSKSSPDGGIDGSSSPA